MHLGSYKDVNSNLYNSTLGAVCMFVFPWCLENISEIID